MQGEVQLEERHVRLGSVAELLSPDVLSRLLGRSVAQVTVAPFVNNEGYSGSNLLHVVVDDEIRLVLKQIRPKEDWHILTTHDQRCRSVTLYQYGILDRLLPNIEHAILACADEAGGWAILMRDVSPWLHPLDRPLTTHQIETSLRALATMHARFWNDQTLKAPQLGLCSPADLMRSHLPTTVQQFPNYGGFVPHMINTGWAILQETMPPDVFDALERLSHDASALLTALAQCPTTLLHGDARTRNMGFPDDATLILFDWQLASCGLMMIDVCWFVDKTDFQLSGYPIEGALHQYQQMLTQRLGKQLDLAAWPKMLELSMLVHSLRMATITAWYARQATDERKRIRMTANLDLYHGWVRDGMKWL